jgi:hypothetical protein
VARGPGLGDTVKPPVWRSWFHRRQPTRFRSWGPAGRAGLFDVALACIEICWMLFLGTEAVKWLALPNEYAYYLWTPWSIGGVVFLVVWCIMEIVIWFMVPKEKPDELP